MQITTQMPETSSFKKPHNFIPIAVLFSAKSKPTQLFNAAFWKLRKTNSHSINLGKLKMTTLS